MYASSNIARSHWDDDQAAFVAALDQAHARALHSYFTQYVLTDDCAGYVAIDDVRGQGICGLRGHEVSRTPINA